MAKATRFRGRDGSVKQETLSRQDEKENCWPQGHTKRKPRVWVTAAEDSVAQLSPSISSLTQ